MTSERGSTNPSPGGKPRSDWIDRVREADAEAEMAYDLARDVRPGLLDMELHSEERIFAALIAIAAELRAQRIARRPGAGR